MLRTSLGRKKYEEAMSGGHAQIQEFNPISWVVSDNSLHLILISEAVA